MDASYFLYKLVGPRPSFAFDLTSDEMEVMGQHVTYWMTHHADRLVAFGPVLDPAGSWGLAVVEADSADEVHAFGAGDPAVTSGLCTFEVHPMGPTIVRSLARDDHGGPEPS